MNIPQPVNWQMFKEQLLQHPDLILQFQYAETKRVKPSYHITEIKQAPVTSVDCGGVLNRWTEVIVQLWEPAEKQQERAMKVSKALSIIDIVEKKLPLNPTAVVKIEFGSSQYDTRQMYPGDLLNDGENLIVDLQPDFTQCKAINRGGTCGTSDKAEECCAPADVKAVAMVNLAAASSCCEPGSGCC